MKLIVCIMVTSLYINRKRSYSIWPSNQDKPGLKRVSSSDALLRHQHSVPRYVDPIDFPATEVPGAGQRCCRKATPTSQSLARFQDHIHSRVMQKYPFLIEMFYWALNYVAYALTKEIAAAIYNKKGHAVTKMAQRNGINILELEHNTFLSFIFHIFLSWYYWAAPSHSTFAIARRTMTLGDFSAFIIFCFYFCMPPRLLPKRFGFKDTVRQDHAESVWVGGANVNQLAAMPSLHFTYAFVIGCTFLYHSGLMQRLRGQSFLGRSVVGMPGFLLAAILYPMLVLTVIVATANHYWLDAAVATISVTLAFAYNRLWCFLLPAERVLCWILRVQKPVPTTGQWRECEAEEYQRRKIAVAELTA
ncbi:hypothetical protein LTR78_001381 [Recurvomyces mirabilis]|uniref:Inositolphosphotransferase Aur1/Ipt1 domain-containing protein n=1 Tax=Recurvomyces mirabilis TaxID=574656 RepID=A0AAE1C5K4_9PEZI|nr:hypothetical protein LTR78_001381 [Recurvomyces mirabilis]KAK5161358.1 hypothetical protein LTS14_001154 [Recurvomyces mirabilis]